MTGFFPDWSPYIWSAVAALTLVVMLMIWGHEIWSKIRARTRLQQADSKLGDHPPLIDGIDSDGDGDLIPMIDGIDMARVALNAELQDNPIVLSSHSGGENIFESVVFEMLGTDESDNVPVYAVKPPMKTPEVIRDIYLKYTIRSDGTATHNMDPRDTLTNLQVCRRDVERWIKKYLLIHEAQQGCRDATYEPSRFPVAVPYPSPHRATPAYVVVTSSDLEAVSKGVEWPVSMCFQEGC